MNNIVTSAISSFNNQALYGASFFWLSLIMLPVFFAAYHFAPVILDELFQNKKKRNHSFAAIAELSLAAWLLLNHGNWDVIRDEIAFLPYMIAIILFFCIRNAIARLYVINPKIPNFWRELGYIKFWIKIVFIMLLVGAAAGSAVQDLPFVAMQISAVMFGIVSGYFTRREISVYGWTSFLFMMTSVAILMQPEFFRFAQLGRLSVLHLGAIAAALVLAPSIFVFRHAKPTGFIKDNHYQYAKWFLRFCLILIMILYALTESVPILIVLAGGVLATVWLAAKHVGRGTDLAPVGNNLWAVMLMAFGVLTVMPVITIAGILCWRNNGVKNFWQCIKEALL